MLSWNVVNCSNLWVKTPLSEALEYAERLGLAGGKCGGPGAAQLLTQEPPVQDGQLLPHLQKRQGKCQANANKYRVPQCMSPRRNWDSPTPLCRKRECPPPPEPKGVGDHTRLRARGRGSPNSDDWRKSLALCLLCDCDALNGVLSKVFYSIFSQEMNSLHEQSSGLSLEIEKKHQLQNSIITGLGVAVEKISRYYPFASERGLLNRFLE